MTYYSTRRTILNREPQPAMNKYGNRRQMERQYHLFCANACDGEENPYDVDSIEWGTLEHGMIDRKCYVKEAPVPEPSKLGALDLKKGCEGDDVKELQADLMKLGYALPKYGADGDFGAETEKAVMAFQQAAGLPVTGVYDEATRAALTGTQPNLRTTRILKGAVIMIYYAKHKSILNGQSHPINNRYNKY